MPTIEKRMTPSGKITYRAKVRVRGYPPQQATFDRKTDAVHWAQRTEADLRQDRHFPGAKAKKLTVTDLINAYLDNLNAKNNRRYKEVKPLLEWWKAEHGITMLTHFRSAEVTKSQQRLLKRARQRKDSAGKTCLLSPATVNRYMVALHSAFEFGIQKLEWIDTNPVAKCDKLPEYGRIRFLTTAEIAHLLDVCKRSKNQLLYGIVLVALSTGARRSELCRMKIEHVNEDATLITIPKTKNRKVRSAFLAGPASEWVKEKREQGGIYLFPSPHDPDRSIDFESAWSHAVEETKFVDFRFHDLRHTCGSHLAMNGASAVEIAEVLGHKTLAMALRYAHLTATHTASVVARMNERMFSHVTI